MANLRPDGVVEPMALDVWAQVLPAVAAAVDKLPPGDASDADAAHRYRVGRLVPDSNARAGTVGDRTYTVRVGDVASRRKNFTPCFRRSGDGW